MTESNLETIRAMRRQEDHYRVSDYLLDLPDAAACGAGDAPVDASCRFLMAKWFSEIAGFCHYKTETVALAMNCLDRFVSSPEGREILFDRNMYQLAAMTALYSSVKIHEQEAMDPGLVSTLSRGVHSPEAVEAMERKMLMAVRWRMNQPSAMSFARLMIDLIPDQYLDATKKDALLDIAKLQIDMTVNEYDFCTHDASSVAFACVLNAIESVTDDGMFYSSVETTMGEVLGADDTSVQDLRFAIYELMTGSDDDGVQRISKASAKRAVGSSFCGGGGVSSKRNSIHSSPRTVAATSVSTR